MCHSCGGRVREVLDYQLLRRVTSDCKPMPEGGRKGVCDRCGLVQSIITEEWNQACHEIYTNYSVYYQSGGSEQAVFSPGSAQGMTRSHRILAQTKGILGLQACGKALDVGCGNGNFLKAFSSLYPEWKLSGCEYNDIYREDILAISGIEAFYEGGIDSLTGRYDFISLIHVLEHIENPIRFLRNVTSLLDEQGILLIEVPFYMDNPFELLIADHASHFDESSMLGVLAAAGLAPVSISTRAVSKEMTVVATRQDQATDSEKPIKEKRLPLARAVSSLLDFRNRALNCRRTSDELAIFGTSIGGTWICSELENHVDYFVDEDPIRIGRTHMGKPIRSLSDFRAGTSLCIPLAPCSAQPLLTRLPKSEVEPIVL